MEVLSLIGDLGLNVVAVGMTVAFCICLRSIADGRGRGSAVDRERAYRRLKETERYETERLRLAKVNAEAETAKKIESSIRPSALCITMPNFCMMQRVWNRKLVSLCRVFFA